MVKIFRNLRKREIGLILLSVIFVAVSVWLDLKLPDYMSEVTMFVKTEGSTMSDVLKAGGKMLLCAFGSLVAAIIVGFFAAQVAAGFSSRLRSRMFSKVGNFSMEEINGFSTASLITRSTNDITQIQNFVAMGLQVMVKAPIMAVWAVCKILGKSWQWTAATGGAVVFLMAVIATVLTFAYPKFKKVQTLTDNLNRVTRENLTGIRVVRAYNAEEYQEKKFSKANDELTDTNIFVFRFMSVMMPSMNIVMNGISLVIYWIGAFLINKAQAMDKITVFSDMVVFSSYAVQVIMSFVMLAMIFIMMPRAAVSAKRINEVLDTVPNIREGSLSESNPENAGTVEFRNVSFRYPDAADNVLENISFTAKKGETVAFIGSTGSGKSTLVNLIPRFYDTTEGEVLVDGVNVREYKSEALNNKLGYVPQKAVMFSGTVASNVSYGKNPNNPGNIPDEVKNAVEIAQGTEFVEKMPDTYNSQIAQGGTNISGGQKQRLAIARAVYRKPEILIFDDSFSALDYKTDRILRSALKKETSATTTLIVAQRIGTIKDADKIIVLDEGKMAGMGTHSELLKNCEVYRQIALSQLSKEELENA
ncbi:MAG: ABC transporter ATP-binding protein [Oscillospiraceae bacterium]|nr:ABC transporter ATP-binding protein [Oscillospiraceae bacterium]